jgi:arylsulfatase A-like enzyme
MSNQPNILLITTDTQRWDTVRCMPGAPGFVHSPNLDVLAAEGVLFENAHTSSPVCMPARCSLMTGVHTHVHGCIENGFARYTHLPMLTDLLQVAGYHNIMVGKAHMGPVPDSFHVQRLTRGEKNADVDDFYGEFIRAQGYSRSTADLEPNPVPEDLFMDAFLTTTAMEEMERALEEQGKPFFCLCSLYSPHGPIDPPGRWATLYDDVSLPPINYVEDEIEDHPPAQRALLGYDEPGKRSVNTVDAETIDQMRRLYYGLAAYCDHQVGRLLRFLDRTGIRENTLVIFTSDHGTQLMDHGFYNKHNWYDESWRVPLIVSQPGTLPVGERRGFAIWNDLTVTILSAAGAGVQACRHMQACTHMQGYDLYTPLTRGESSPRQYAVACLFKSAALATCRFKLAYYFEDGRGSLFDRLNDPCEQRDLWDDPTYREIRDRLLYGLLAWYGDTMDLRGLVARSHRGGPIARRAVAHMKQVSGLDAEERLNRICQEVDGFV